MDELTHFNEEGRAKMVDVGVKLNTKREAIAQGSIYMDTKTLNRVINKDIQKGDVLAVAQVAGIMAAKNTSQLVPMCHHINITGANIHFNIDEQNSKIDIKAIISTTGKTGVEIEALTAVSIAALTIYDMCKVIDKSMKISEIKVLKKVGGKSGDYEIQE
ncbi:cyclic pyranopterin monophosphate synthase MoaC [Serpentinicella sp. ANB-PHB4]|uniref:cyclic pyranopterin monophosphate synthase MoaC n=1 Tax=Serpentinicella sp. ANB-PHB4 TaxID=3074076 RepID=UPI00285C7B59|nr:cyclic pyranopterin monophosphate synthase MoaC [Serpentinicella sp. ANB-PHB4]MDR5660053.1 cyclic pyranopterin monophosphate synthase MoaC [Serpentinicella sp. ANB-PHB4]